jgi:hypothetical protein
LFTQSIIFRKYVKINLVIGGLLSAHLLAKRMNIPVNSTWPCTGPLLDLAIALAKKLLPGKRKTKLLILHEFFFRSFRYCNRYIGLNVVFV